MQSTINDIQLPKELQEKRGVDMTGEDFLIIMMEVMKINPSPTIHQKPTYIRGKKALANHLQCSISTISRWLDCKVIHDEAVIRLNKVLLFNVDVIMRQLHENEQLRFNSRS